MTIAASISCHPELEDVSIQIVNDKDSHIYWLEFKTPNSAYGHLSIYLKPGLKAAILQALSEVPDA